MQELPSSILCCSRMATKFLSNFLMQGNQLAANQDLVTALFHLASQCILIAPALALACGALPSLFQWAVQGLQMREAEPLRKVIAFLSHWTAPTSSLISDADKQASPREARLSCESAACLHCFSKTSPQCRNVSVWSVVSVPRRFSNICIDDVSE